MIRKLALALAVPVAAVAVGAVAPSAVPECVTYIGSQVGHDYDGATDTWSVDGAVYGHAATEDSCVTLVTS